MRNTQILNDAQMIYIFFYTFHVKRGTSWSRRKRRFYPLLQSALHPENTSQLYQQDTRPYIEYFGQMYVVKKNEKSQQYANASHFRDALLAR